MHLQLLSALIYLSCELLIDGLLVCYAFLGPRKLALRDSYCPAAYTDRLRLLARLLVVVKHASGHDFADLSLWWSVTVAPSLCYIGTFLSAVG